MKCEENTYYLRQPCKNQYHYEKTISLIFLVYASYSVRVRMWVLGRGKVPEYEDGCGKWSEN